MTTPSANTWLEAINDPERVRLLIEAGADINARINKILDLTPLHMAGRNTEVVVLLINASADTSVAGCCDIEARDVFGNTPLIEACCFAKHVLISISNAEKARLLLEAGANISTTNNKGETALDKLFAFPKLSPEWMEVLDLIKKKYPEEYVAYYIKQENSQL